MSKCAFNCRREFHLDRMTQRIRQALGGDRYDRYIKQDIILAKDTEDCEKPFDGACMITSPSRVAYLLKDYKYLNEVLDRRVGILDKEEYNKMFFRRMEPIQEQKGRQDDNQ